MQTVLRVSLIFDDFIQVMILQTLMAFTIGALFGYLTNHQGVQYI